MPTDLIRLRRLLGGPDTEWLITRLRDRMACGQELIGPVRLRDPSPAQRTAIDGLLGRRSTTSGTIGVTLEQLDAVLIRAGIHDGGLESAVTLLTGPVAIRAETAAAAERAWSEALAEGSQLVARVPVLESWWDSRRAVVRRLTDGDPAAAARLVGDIVTVLDALPVGRELLNVFAARTLGNAHSLDPGRPVTGLVLAALRALADLPDEADRRTTWSSAGIVVDELSSRVLTLGLSADAATAGGRAVNLWRSSGQPVVLTLRQLTSATQDFTPGPDVYVCENPAVVATAADRLGPACPPLICTEGQPGTAVMVLLDQLTASGARLRYHGDFDWYGIAIANYLHRRYKWRPWRFSASDYAAIDPPADLTALRGTVREAAWDPDLSAVMARRGVQIEEEHVIDDLMVDLNAP